MKNSKAIQSYFEKLFPDPHCELEFCTPYQMLVSVVLSAQCTDKRVNQVTKTLFKVAPEPKSMQKLETSELETLIKSCGFYHNKAKAIKELTNDILQKFDGQIPNNFEDLTSLRGVGRKTANVVLATAFDKPAFAVDTHVFRVSHRLGLSDANTPDKCEQDLTNIFEKKDWSKTHYQMVLFGRYVCKAQKPNCPECELKNICLYYKNKNEKK